jgi:hypothetical protein
VYAVEVAHNQLAMPAEVRTVVQELVVAPRAKVQAVHHATNRANPRTKVSVVSKSKGVRQYENFCSLENAKSVKFGLLPILTRTTS